MAEEVALSVGALSFGGGAALQTLLGALGGTIKTML